MKLSYLILFIAIVGSIFFIFTTGNAFSSLDLDRSNDVNVVSDSNGVVGLEHNTLVQTGQTNQELVTVTNNNSEIAYITLYLIEDTPEDAVFSASGNTQRYINLNPSESKTIFIDVNNGKNTSAYVDYKIEVVYESQVNVFLDRSVTEIQHKTITSPNGEIVVSVTEKGNSGNYNIDYTVGGDTTQYDRVDIYVNNTFIESRTVFDDTIKAKKIGAEQGDTVTIEVIQNESVVDSGEATI